MKLDLSVLTPSRELFSGEVESVSLPGGQGRFQVLCGHRSLHSTLVAGPLYYRQVGEEHHLEVGGGVAEVRDAITSLDNLTQQNAEMADNSARMANRLSQTIDALAGKVEKFQIAARDKTARDDEDVPAEQVQAAVGSDDMHAA